MITRSYISILFSIFLVRFTIFSSIPFLYIYITQNELGSAVEAGLIVGLLPLTSSITGLFGGYLADRLDRRNILIFSCLFSSTAFILFSLNQSLAVCAGFAFMIGFCQGFFEPASQTILGEMVDPKHRQRAFSHRYLIINVAATAGPFAGGLIFYDNKSTSFLIISLIYLVSSYVIFSFIKPQKTVEKSEKSHKSFSFMLNTLMTNNSVRTCFLSGLLLMCAYSQITSTLSIFVIENSDGGVTYFSKLLALNAILVITLQLPLTRAAETISRNSTILFSSVAMAAGFALPIISEPSEAMFITMIVLISIGEVLLFPISNSLFFEIAPDGQRASFMGFFNATMLGLAIGPPLGSIAVEHVDMSGLSLIIFFSVLLSGFGYLFITKKQTQTEH
ncbi:MAG: MFS transporter [Endozoicomonas sp.]|uniref:MFS transporter n=1 Tax=Endozoicomonas sp. TaxID=1892382 RepID=UPI003D9BBACC